MERYPTLGFIGTGTITAALVRGFCSAGAPYPILLSPRNARQAAALQASYPAQVRVAASNQEVVDGSDWLILAVVPQIGEEVLRALRFRPEHKVVNLLSDKSLEQIRAWIGATEVLVHLVPLPFAAERIGPIVLYPAQPEAQALFAHVGQVIPVETPREVHVLAAITALMAPYFSLLDEIVLWSARQGLAPEVAQSYSTAFFAALSKQAAQISSEELSARAREMTPGGLNHMAKSAIAAAGGFAAWTEALDPVMTRLEEE